MDVGRAADGQPPLHARLVEAPEDGHEVVGAGRGRVLHAEKMPRKGASTYNERGEWLRAQKEKRQAKEIDAAWLKEYKEKK